MVHHLVFFKNSKQITKRTILFFIKKSIVELVKRGFDIITNIFFCIKYSILEDIYFYSYKCIIHI